MTTAITKKKPVPSQEVQAHEELQYPQQLEEQEVQQQPEQPGVVYLSPIEAEQARQRRVMTAAAIVSNGAVRQVAQIMQNGTRMSAHEHVQFTTHEGLLIKMLKAYELPDRAEAEKQFLETLEQYLEQATLFIPHAGRKEDVPILIGLLTLLIHEHEAEHGFDEVARYILRAATAPVDRF